MLEDAKQLAELKVENDDVLALTYQLTGIQGCPISDLVRIWLKDVSALMQCHLHVFLLMQMGHGKMSTLLSMFLTWTAMHTANNGETESKTLHVTPIPIWMSDTKRLCHSELSLHLPCRTDK